MDKPTAEKVVTLLNHVLMNQEQGSASTNQKLDQILEFLETHTPSPYDPVVLYSFDGLEKRIVTNGGENHVATVGGPTADAFRAMQGLESEKDWNGLLTLCKKEVAGEKNWATPYLFCSEAHLNLGDLTAASEELKAAKAIVHESPDYSQPIGQLTKALQQATKH
jgi:hypothetical protein